MNSCTIVGENYRNGDECRYFGSDLNKFIHENCSKKMIVNNIDCIIYKYGNRSVRIIESKHDKESCRKSQLDVLKLLAKMSSDEAEIEVYILSGNPPYEICDIMRINDETAAIKVPQDKLIQFLNFGLDFNDLVGTAPSRGMGEGRPTSRPTDENK